MYHRTRSAHKWVGVVAALFLLIISATGFLLATKSQFGWIRPPEADGGELTHLREVVTVAAAAEAAFELQLAELRSHKDIDRIDYRPKSNVFKIVSKDGYKEVQVDGATGKVLQVATRTDQLAEDIHDLSFFADGVKDYGLPIVALGLFGLAASGIGIFFVPVVRRWKFARKRKEK